MLELILNESGFCHCQPICQAKYISRTLFGDAAFCISGCAHTGVFGQVNSLVFIRPKQLLMFAFRL